MQLLISVIDWEYPEEEEIPRPTVWDLGREEGWLGVVLEGAGLGHVGKDCIGRIRERVRGGLIVCMTSQCIFGRVDGFVFSTGREVSGAGVIFLGDMLPEVGLVNA